MSPISKALAHVANAAKRATMRRRATFFLLADWVWVSHIEGFDDFAGIVARIDRNRVAMGVPSVFD